jgi:NTE family protein
MNYPSTQTRRPALVLGGGGAFGVIQAAYMMAAHEAGFRPSIVVGTSVGSLNGAWLALHPEQPGELLKIWLELDRLKLVALSPWRLASKLLRSRLSLSTNNVVPQLVSKYLGPVTFNDTELELGVVSTNLTRAEKHVFRWGPLGEAILASTAIPGVFDPVEIDGELYVDGCVTASVDLATAFEMGATEIFAIDLTPAPGRSRPKTAVGVIKQSFGILTSATTNAMESCLSAMIPVRVVRPDLTNSSPWRLDDSAGSVAHNLRLAHSAIRGLFDADGHVIAACPIGGPLPAEAAAEPVRLEQYFHRRLKRQA